MVVSPSLPTVETLGIEDINNNYALPLTVLAAVTVHSRLDARRHQRSRTQILRPLIGSRTDIAQSCGHPMRGGGGSFGHWVAFSNSQVSPTTTEEHWDAPARTV